MKKIFLHAGMHKTGSTSIQAYLNSNVLFFSDRNFHIVRDLDIFDLGVDPSSLLENCYRIAHILIDNRLKTSTRIRGTTKSLSFAKKLSAANKVNTHLQNASSHQIIMSSEALSYLRTWREQLWYWYIFRGFQIQPIIFFRNKTDWLRSWRAEIKKSLPNWIADGRLPAGIYDVSETSWLVDYDRIRKFFTPHGIYLSYEDSVSEYGSVIPPFLKSLGLNLDDCPAWDGIWLNNSAIKLVAKQ